MKPMSLVSAATEMLPAVVEGDVELARRP